MNYISNSSNVVNHKLQQDSVFFNKKPNSKATPEIQLKRLLIGLSFLLFIWMLMIPHYVMAALSFIIFVTFIVVCQTDASSQK